MSSEVAGGNALDRTVLEEYALARQEGRQPLCVYCGEPLEVGQSQGEIILWNWNKEKGRFTKSTCGGDADKPYCLTCDARDWNFIDSLSDGRNYENAFINF